MDNFWFCARAQSTITCSRWWELTDAGRERVVSRLNIMRMRRVAILLCIGLLTAASTGPGLVAHGVAAPVKAEDDFQLVKVADGVYAAIAKPGGLASGNAGFVIGDGGVLIFDTFFTPAAIEELISTIESQTKLPIKYGVNSHFHLDHTGGNQVLIARE